MTSINDVAKVTWADGEPTPRLSYLLSNSKKLVAALDAIPEEFLSLGERRLEHRIRHTKKDRIFPRALGLLKIRFWEEYRLAISEHRLMRCEDVFYGICLVEYWQKHVVENPLHLAWMIHPPTDELVAQKEIIALGMKKLRAVFDHPITKKGKNGELIPDIPLIKEMHAIVKTMQDRVNGSVIERKAIEKRITANINTLPPPPTTFVDAPQKALPSKKDISLSSPDVTMQDLLDFHENLQKTEKLLSKMEKAAEESAPDLVEGEVIGE